MIKKEQQLTEADLDRILAIWLAGNLEAHDFIASTYWHQQEELVRELLPQAAIYTYRNQQGQIQGFMGIMDDYIAGIFVEGTQRGSGIGRQLLAAAKAEHDQLSLSVYRKNLGAIRFYQGQGFTSDGESTDEATGESELQMVWQADPR